MDEFIDSRFERVEKALATLINSISTYNLSPQLANDLVTADAELNQSLEQVSLHQSNHAKIVALRNTSKGLDTQIRDNLTLLAETRRALIGTPSTTFPSKTNPVSFFELLSYARRISKFTVPSSLRDHELLNKDPADGTTNTPKDVKSAPPSNGRNTPIVANGVESHTQTGSAAMDIDGALTAGQTQASQTSNTQLPKDLSDWLNPSADLPFIPWPTEEAIRRGALASIKVLVDQGVDPATFDPERSAELEAERKRIMEEEDRAREEERIRIEEERRREMERRMSVSAAGSAPRREEQTTKFNLETFDDDDDE